MKAAQHLWHLGLVLLTATAGCDKRQDNSASATPTAVPPVVCRPTEVDLQAAEPVTNRAARVYWDVSGTMAAFADVRQALIDSLDSRLLPRAEAGLITHVLAGDTLTQLEPGELSRPLPRTAWSALHEVARDAGEQLAADDSETSSVGVVIIVSDMVVEVPASVRESGPELCPGLAMPTREFAGPSFGHCLAAGVRGHAPSGRLPAFYAQTLQYPADLAARNLFVTILATNVALGRAIGQEFVAGLQEFTFSSHVLVDTALTRSEPSCEWQQTDFLVLDEDAAGACKARCADDGIVSVLCRTGLPATSMTAVTLASPRVALEVWQDAPAKNVSSEMPLRAALFGHPSPDSVPLQIGCEDSRAGSGSLDLLIKATTPWKASDLSLHLQDPTPRDAFESLVRVVPELVEPVRTELRIDLYSG